MSSIASFYIITKDKVETVKSSIKPPKGLFKSVDTFQKTLEEVSIKCENYSDTGYDIGAIIPYLDLIGCSIGQSDYLEIAKKIVDERGITAITINEDDKELMNSHSEVIDKIDEKELKIYYSELYGIEDAKSGKRMKNGIRQIFDLVKSINDQKILLILIG